MIVVIIFISIWRIIHKFEKNNSYRDLLVEVDVDTVVETDVDTLVVVDVDPLELTEVDVEVLVLALEYVE